MYSGRGNKGKEFRSPMRSKADQSIGSTTRVPDAVQRATTRELWPKRWKELRNAPRPVDGLDHVEACIGEQTPTTFPCLAGVLVIMFRSSTYIGGIREPAVSAQRPSFNKCPNITAALQSGSPENYKAAPNSFEMIFGRHHCHVGASCLSGLGTGK